MRHLNKFYLILIVAVAILSLIFVWQLRKTFGIDIETNKKQLISEEIYNITISEKETPRGNPGAATTIIEYLDVTCVDCLEKYSELNQLVDKNPGKIRLFLRPAETGGLLSRSSLHAHIAAYCANEQKHYWPFLESLMQKEKRWSEEALTQSATEAGININSWENCRENENTIITVNNSLQMANELGIKKSPTIFINNKMIDPETKISLTELINKLIQ